MAFNGTRNSTIENKNKNKPRENYFVISLYWKDH